MVSSFNEMETFIDWPRTAGFPAKWSDSSRNTPCDQIEAA